MGQYHPLLGDMATRNCKGIWEISLAAQELEKMNLGKEVFPEAHGVCTDPWWHTHMSTAAHSRIHTCHMRVQTQAQSQGFTYVHTSVQTC